MDDEELIQRLYVPREVTSAWDDTKTRKCKKKNMFNSFEFSLLICVLLLLA